MIEVIDAIKIILETETDINWIAGLSTYIFPDGSFRERIYLNADKFGKLGQAVHMDFSKQQRLHSVQFDNQPVKVIR